MDIQAEGLNVVLAHHIIRGIVRNFLAFLVF
jgi:hypothetical protein